MFKYLFFISMSLLFACAKSKPVYNFSIPDKKDINEIIEAIIVRDSLSQTNIPLSIDLSKIQIDFNEKVASLPPPPGFYKVSVRPLAKLLNSISRQYKLSEQDSLYLLFQNTILNQFKATISSNNKIKLTSLVEQNKRRKQGKMIHYFDVSIPIFSLGQKNAYVQLNSFCSGQCGYGEVFVLTKIHNRWTVINRFGTWIS